MIILPELFDQGMQLLQVTVADEITLTDLVPRLQPQRAPIAEPSRRGRTADTAARFTIFPIGGDRSIWCSRSVVFGVKRAPVPAKLRLEQFPQLARPHAQRTLQLQEALCQVGIVLGGQAGADLGCLLGLSGSRDTILRLLRTYQLPETTPPKKVGVDDWAWKRGHRYGTLLCEPSTWNGY